MSRQQECTIGAAVVLLWNIDVTFKMQRISKRSDIQVLRKLHKPAFESKDPFM